MQINALSTDYSIITNLALFFIYFHYLESSLNCMFMYFILYEFSFSIAQEEPKHIISETAENQNIFTRKGVSTTQFYIPFLNVEAT